MIWIVLAVPNLLFIKQKRFALILCDTDLEGTRARGEEADLQNFYFRICILTAKLVLNGPADLTRTSGRKCRTCRRTETCAHHRWREMVPVAAMRAE